MKDRFKFRIWKIQWKEWANKKVVEDCRIGFLPKVSSNYTVEQCTGLKDKNGRLIYEGDIVEYTFYANRALYGNYGDYKYKGVILWETNGFNTESYADKIEVIGNIHENPELVKEMRLKR